MIKIKAYLKVIVLLFTSYYTQAQCDIFKSEISDVQKYMVQVSQLTDSLSTAAETASYNASLSAARANTKTVMLLMGQAVNAADEAVILASEAQYDSEKCGLGEAMSYTIDAEKNAIDTRDFASEVYDHVKSASNSKNLGNLQFHMRIAQRILREVRNSAEASAYAADNAHYSCSHNLDHASLD
ncbi:hypothetical protein [Maribacter hydrothermalis]|uniref:DUF4142 domain-containing protein n=1 Tax=Maribacter hydrothermalis TaxID=1836467 RepID=A0A1B7Z483_9FLAO|nr:hypothetical protein [Maribacter hydrothermalis]APQ17278.1 hypothetical protein BTR34_08030 [Maribacter hydrothermalis]OBR37537.1 hypothetical protein A9200_07780 [Maribacter hydrothermalis]